MAAIWLVALLLGSAFAIASGQGAKWKLLNTVIILGCMALGLVLGYSLSLGRGNFGFVGGEGVAFPRPPFAQNQNAPQLRTGTIHRARLCLS
jgi:hypothetical protein